MYILETYFWKVANLMEIHFNPRLSWALCLFKIQDSAVFEVTGAYFLKICFLFCRVVLNPNVLLCLKSPSTSPSNVIKHLNMSLGISVHKRTHIRWEGGLIYIPYLTVILLCALSQYFQIYQFKHSTHTCARSVLEIPEQLFEESGFWTPRHQGCSYLICICPPAVENGLNTKTDGQTHR